MGRARRGQPDVRADRQLGRDGRIGRRTPIGGRARGLGLRGLGLLAAGAVAFAAAGAPRVAGAMSMGPPDPKGPENAVAFQEDGPPGLGRVPSFVDLPVRVERLPGDQIVLEINHPRAEELGLDTPFLSILLGPANSPRFARVLGVPEPGAVLLLGLAGAAALWTRRRRRA